MIDVLDQLARRRHGNKISERATVRCTKCDDYELTVSYSGDPEAGGVGTAINDDADLTTCPVCGADTESEVA